MLWLDAVLLLVITEVVSDSIITSYLPVSEDVAAKGIAAAGKEKFAQKQLERERHFAYTL